MKMRNLLSACCERKRGTLGTGSPKRRDMCPSFLHVHPSAQIVIPCVVAFYLFYVPFVLIFHSSYTIASSAKAAVQGAMAIFKF